jgi:serine/threonine protein kinase
VSIRFTKAPETRKSEHKAFQEKCSVAFSQNRMFTGIEIEGYKVEEPVDSGSIGAVYLLRRATPPDVRAVKFIRTTSLRRGWENEIVKVVKLGLTEGVVKYQRHGKTVVDGEDYLWISWDYIKGCSLKRCILEKTVTLPILIDVIRRVLAVLHACKQIGIQHGDLHTGNILVEDDNPLYIDRERRRIWITDFGYCTASDGHREMLDDFVGLNRIVGDSLAAIDFHSLDAPAKGVFRALRREFPKELLETQATEGDWVRQPSKILRKLEIALKAADSPAPQSARRIGDYLAAEAIGDRESEWRELFVPEFIGRSTLLERNICILTGLRGCGKTMVFRRLTALFDARLGPSNVEGADRFLGFYFNARSVAEAFPWLPDDMEQRARSQIISYFHLSWCLEVIDWLKEITKSADSQAWLVIFFKDIFKDRLLITEGTATSLFHLRTFLSQELENCRLTSSYHGNGWDWEFSDLTFLDRFCATLRTNLPQVGERPFYFFLDDYSTPLVNATMQRILNPVIFRRSSSLTFKIATESTESFEPIGLNGKTLEDGNDYVLIDCSSHVITRSDRANTELLTAILKPRIDRDPLFSGRNLSLDSILGVTPYSNNALARSLAAPHQPEVQYSGSMVFSSLYSSNIREMISLFAELVSLEDSETLRRPPGPSGLIRREIQNKTLREAGGKFVTLLSAATNPSHKLYQVSSGDRSFGDHLCQIADAFQVIARHELKTKRSKNGQANNHKQARKIELVDFSKDLPEDVRDYYRGLVRYGLFIRDFRGKSRRGKVGPRLVVRGLLVPFFAITFSKRDHITMNFDEFCEFLRHPKQFAEQWIKADDTMPLQFAPDEAS